MEVTAVTENLFPFRLHFRPSHLRDGERLRVRVQEILQYYYSPRTVPRTESLAASTLKLALKHPCAGGTLAHFRPNQLQKHCCPRMVLKTESRSLVVALTLASLADALMPLASNQNSYSVTSLSSSLRARVILGWFPILTASFPVVPELEPRTSNPVVAAPEQEARAPAFPPDELQTT